MVSEKREMVKEEKMLSIEAIAEELGTSLKQIRRYVASGQLAAEQSGSKYLIPETTYKAFCDQYTVFDEGSGVRKLGTVEVQFLPGLGVDPEEKLIRKSVKENKVKSRVDFAQVAKESSGRRAKTSKGVLKKSVCCDDVNWGDISASWNNPGRYPFVPGVSFPQLLFFHNPGKRYAYRRVRLSILPRRWKCS
jgi:excisionase family DNA binding protein